MDESPIKPDANSDQALDIGLNLEQTYNMPSLTKRKTNVSQELDEACLTAVKKLTTSQEA